MKDWNKLASSILDPDDIKNFEWVVGAMAFGNMNINKNVVLSGPPKSGKSTLIKILLRTLGYDQPAQIIHDSLTKVLLDYDSSANVFHGNFSIIEANIPTSEILAINSNNLLIIKTHGHEDNRKLAIKDYTTIVNWLEYNHWCILNESLKTYMEFGEGYLNELVS